MHYSDTRKLISILYVITVLFLGTMFFQGEIINEPGAISTLNSVNASAAGQFIASFKMSGVSAVMTIASVTLFFGLILFATRSESY